MFRSRYRVEEVVMVLLWTLFFDLFGRFGFKSGCNIICSCLKGEVLFVKLRGNECPRNFSAASHRRRWQTIIQTIVACSATSIGRRLTSNGVSWLESGGWALRLCVLCLRSESANVRLRAKHPSACLSSRKAVMVIPLKGMSRMYAVQTLFK